MSCGIRASLEARRRDPDDVAGRRPLAVDSDIEITEIVSSLPSWQENRPSFMLSPLHLHGDFLMT